MGILGEAAKCSNTECGKEIVFNEQYGDIMRPFCFDCWLAEEAWRSDDDKNQSDMSPYAKKTAGARRACPICENESGGNRENCRWCNGTKLQVAFVCQHCNGSGIGEHVCDCQFCQEEDENCTYCHRGIRWRAAG